MTNEGPARGFTGSRLLRKLVGSEEHRLTFRIESTWRSYSKRTDAIDKKAREKGKKLWPQKEVSVFSIYSEESSSHSIE